MLANFGKTCWNLPNWERLLWQQVGYSGRMTHRHECFSHVSRSSASLRKCLTVCGWLEYFRSDQKARFMDSTWPCQWVHDMSMTWHTAFSLNMLLCCSEACCSQTTQISLRRGTSHQCAAPWLQIPLPVNWGSDLNCYLSQPFRQSTEKLGNCHPVVKPGNLMLGLALWNAISK